MQARESLAKVFEPPPPIWEIALTVQVKRPSGQPPVSRSSRPGDLLEIIQTSRYFAGVAAVSCALKLWPYREASLPCPTSGKLQILQSALWKPSTVIAACAGFGGVSTKYPNPATAVIASSPGTLLKKFRINHDPHSAHTVCAALRRCVQRHLSIGRPHTRDGLQ
jgi:hypothetical protein